MEESDKRHWERTEGVDQRAPRHSLSVPDMAEAMARGLGRMATPAPGATGRPAGQDAPAGAGMPALVAAPPARPETAERARLPVQREQLEDKLDARPSTPAPKGMFAHFAPPTQVDTDAGARRSPPPQVDGSLSALFARLERGQTQPEPTPAVAPPRAAFLSRLGRQ